MRIKTKIITENTKEELESTIQNFFNEVLIQELYSCSYTAVKPDAKSKVEYSVLIVYKIHSII